MIFRLLLLFLIIWFLFWIIKNQLSGNSSTKAENKPGKLKDKAEDMVACDYCGTHVPKSLGVQQDDKFYCCQEHADIETQN